MRKIYRFLGLVGDHQLVMNISKDAFIAQLKPHVGNDINSTLDIFSSSEIHYKGTVGYSGFYLRRKRGLFTKNRHYCKVTGTFREESDQLVIDMEINNIMNPPIIIFYSMFALFNLFALSSIFIGIISFDYARTINAIFMLFSSLTFSAIVAGIIYLFSTKTIQQMKYELENSFYSYLKNKHNSKD
jgi:hypothetical protein